MMEAKIYFLAIAAAELVTVYGNPRWGMTGHAVIMILSHAKEQG
ncbi:unnamed protein product [marine sediment metagenome]|uniref:Uncharacterized protein n=1 Tax=marine sediment metagenome TaxID=412755 RepID=X1E0F9_9ZZZZ